MWSSHACAGPRSSVCLSLPSSLAGKKCGSLWQVSAMDGGAPQLAPVTSCPSQLTRFPGPFKASQGFPETSPALEHQAAQGSLRRCSQIPAPAHACSRAKAELPGRLVGIEGRHALTVS